MAQIPELVHSLTAGLRQGTYECSVCTDLIASLDPRWSCRHCHGVFHLPCIKFWAESQIEQLTKERRGIETRACDGSGGQRFSCPLCQAKNDAATTAEYLCFCGKVPSPKYDAMLVPGACGQMCDRAHADEECTHNCTLTCHPGPCPECPRTRPQSCYCGANERDVGCSSNIHGYECGEVCGRELSCGRHYCEQTCHAGACKPCPLVRIEQCYCGKSSAERACAPSSGYSCHSPCGKLLDCGVHRCAQKCHDGPCAPCERAPERQKTCPCGKAQLWELRHRDTTGTVPSQRAACTDKIPTCGQPCGLPLRCGEHVCTAPCHDTAFERREAAEAKRSKSGEEPSASAAADGDDGDDADNCPPCAALVTLACRCGQQKKKDQPCFVTYLPKSRWLPLAQARGLPREVVKGMVRDYPFQCEKRCSHALSCGRHKCEEQCCENEGHICMKTCRKKAPCGVHECGQLCHPGPCPPCANIGVDPLYCRCRRSVVDPPVPCGTRTPKCNHPCIVPRPCGHRPNHNCHPDDPCPPCTEAVPKHCASHDTRMPFNQPCYLPYVSCGRKCHKALTCCGKACEMTCHAGECVHKCAGGFPDLAAGAAKKQ